MQIVLLPNAEKDLNNWRKTGNRAILSRIELLIESIIVNPFEGIGKPEPLKHNLKGCWSRRIDKEHRFVYEISNDKIIIHSLKGHY